MRKLSFPSKISPIRTLPIGARAVSQSALSHPSGVAGGCLRATPALSAKNAPVAQLDRASDYESEGRTFESFRARHFGIDCRPGHADRSHPFAVKASNSAKQASF